MGLRIEEALEALEDTLSPEDFAEAKTLMPAMMKVFYGRELTLAARLKILEDRMEKFLEAIRLEDASGSGITWVNRATQVALRERPEDAMSFAEMDVAAKAVIKSAGEAEDKKAVIDFETTVPLIEYHEGFVVLEKLGKVNDTDKNTIAELFVRAYRQTVNALICGDAVKRMTFQGKKANDEDIVEMKSLRTQLREWFPAGE